MRKLFAIALVAGLAATQSHAASGPFFSLKNTDFVVLLAFLLFIAVLVYFKVPGLIGGLLDKRAAQIRTDLEEARNLREDAQKVLASYERKSREVAEQAERIVKHAREEALLVAEETKKELEASLVRRLKAAEEQIASAEAGAIRAVRDRAVQVAVAAAGEVIAKSMSEADANALIESSIRDVEAKLH